MATTFYSTASSGFRCRCDYNVSSTNTTTTVSGTIYLQHNGAAQSMALGWVAGIGWGNYSTDDYISVTTAEVTSVAKHTSWTNVKSTTFSFPYSNSHSASTVYLIIATGNVLVNKGIARNAVTIPAKPSYAVTYYSYNGTVWANDTKYYNETYRLLRSTPTRSGYVFDRWNTQADGSGTDYAAYSTYTTNEPLALYAQWYAVPTISSLTVVRCDAQGQEDSDGHCALVTCVWSIASETATVTGKITPQGGTQTAFAFSEGSTGTSGTAIAIISANNGLEIDPDTQYVVEVTATNNAYSSATTSVNEILTRAYFVMDFKAGGLGVGIGRAAPTNGLEIGYETSFDENVNFYADVLIDISNYQISGTVDKEIYDALVSLGWDSDVIV
ncbi:MAG: InlB B-repeat-containing protein [Aeriscardovia sp.]|nr:InlB B-repeat-containing protein [Aeriscardovia sp.]